jgi:type II secretory pathway pseudopilin PulG
MNRRGAMLLEMMLALAIFVMAGTAILTLVDGSVRSLERARLHAQAADLARTAMAKIEAGIATPRSLHGPARSWLEEAAERGEAPEDLSAPRQGPTGWELRIESDPSQFAGLTRVTITAAKLDASEAPLVSYTLRQLVRLGGREEDRAGEIDELLGRQGGRPARRQEGRR